MTRKTILIVFCSFWIAFSYAQTANFTASVTSGCSPMVVNFQDQSTGSITSWFWDFGNGATATLQNPSTTYFIPGTYTVTLTVKNGQSSNTLTRTQYITVYPKPSINFTVNDSTACYPHRAQFTDLSVAGAGTVNSTWLWDFGDGSQANTKNPLHVYTSSGNYTVTLKVTNDKGCNTVLNKTAYIRIAGGVQAGFTNSVPTVCRPPFNISFTNSGTGPGALTWFWDFGDGSTSNQQNPLHTYTTPGNYTVSSSVTSSDGCSDTARKQNVVKIEDIKTRFNIPDSVCTNTSVNFQNNSTPTPVSNNWIFGDGATSTAASPQKSYATAGTYLVQLFSTYSYCTDSTSKSIKVLPRPVAGFNADVTFKCQPSLTVNFQDQSVNAVRWQWSFGDGGSSNQQNPTHTYSVYGKFDVQLVVTNSSGCTDTLKKIGFIDVTSPVITFPTLPIEGCIPYNVNFGAGIVTPDVVTSYLWNFGDGTPNSTLANPAHVYPNQGTYNISLTITTSTGCTQTAALAEAVKVGRTPIVNFSAAPNPVCAFQPVLFKNLTNESDKWVWIFGDGGTSTLENPTHAFADTGTFSIKLVATNNGCKDSLTIQDYLTIKPPVPRFGFQTDCSNRLRFQFLDSSLISGPTKWFWNFGDGTTDTVQNPLHFFGAYQFYTVSLTVTNDSCSNTITKQINVFHETIDFKANTTDVCRVGKVVLQPISNNQNNLISYLWDLGNGDSGPGFPGANGTYPLSGQYTVKLVTTDIYGCKDTIVKPNYIRVHGPTANFSGTNTTGCKNLLTTFNDLSVSDGVSNVVSWKWDFGEGFPEVFNAPPFQHRYRRAGTYSVKLTVTDAGGCMDSLTIRELVVITAPKADFSSIDTFSCPGGTVRFINNTSSPLSFTSSWNFGDGNSSNLNSPSNIYANTGLYTVQLKITDVMGCSDSITRTDYIRVKKPTAEFTMSDSISSCTPFEVQFNNNSQYIIGSLWDLGGGMSTLINPIQFYNSPGTYPIKMIAYSPGGCTDTAYGTVRVFDTTGSRIRYVPLDGCKPVSVDLAAFTSGPMNYTWDFGDGVLVTGDSTKINHIYNFFGDFVPKVIMTDPAGCIIPVTGVDTIRIKGATVKFGLDKGLFCDSGQVIFTDSTLYNDSLTLYHWDFGDGGSSTLQNPTYYYSSPGLYTVSLNVQTQNACVDTFRIVNGVKVVASPLISIGGDSIICINDLMTHLGVFERPDTSAIKWSWQFPNGGTSTLQNPLQQKYNTTGNFVVKTSVINSSGCRDSATKNIFVMPLPTITLPSTMTMQAGFPVTIPATYSSGVVGYMWSPSNTLNCTDCPQPVASTKFNTKYSVTFVDSNGCRNTGEVQIVVICKDANVFIPNTFSPNGDGSNDVFFVRGRGLDRVKSLRIFNRWGEVVFEKTNFPVNDPLYGWDGKYKGNKPIPDVYVYQVEVFCDNSQIIRFDGNIALIQ